MNIGVYADGDLAVWKCKLNEEASGGRSAGGVLAMNNSLSITANVYVINSDVGAAASASYYGIGFGASGNVVLREDSWVSVLGAGGTYSYGTQCGDLTVDGDSWFGTYGGYIREDTASKCCYGISADKIDLADGGLDAFAGKAKGESYAVEAYGAITVSADGEIYAESEGTTDGDSSSYGVWSMDDITVEANGALYGVSGSASLAGFPDGGKTSVWAQEAMSWAVSVGLFRGDETGALNPGGEATRAEVATLVQRLVKLIVG